MVVAMRTATARLLRWGSKSNVPRVGVRGHGLCVQLRVVKQAVKFGNLENWKIYGHVFGMNECEKVTHAHIHLFETSCITWLIWLVGKNILQFRRTVATTDKPSWFSLPFTLVKIESTTNWLHHMAISEGSQPKILNKIIARFDRLDAWRDQTSSTVRVGHGVTFSVQ